MGDRINRLFIKLLSKVLRRVERFREKYPQEKAKGHTALFLLLVLAAPLLLLVFAFHLPMIIWDLLDPWDIDVPNLIHLCFGFLYAGSMAFVALEIWEAWEALEIIYHPIKAITENAVESLLTPLRNGLIKIDVVIGVIVLAVVTTDSVSIYLTGLTGFHIAVFVLILLIGAIMFGISLGIYYLIKGSLILIIEVIFKKMDRTFHISDALKGFYERVSSEEIIIDVEPNPS